MSEIGVINQLKLYSTEEGITRLVWQSTFWPCFILKIFLSMLKEKKGKICYEIQSKWKYRSTSSDKNAENIQLHRDQYLFVFTFHWVKVVWEYWEMKRLLAFLLRVCMRESDETKSSVIMMQNHKNYFLSSFCTEKIKIAHYM